MKKVCAYILCLTLILCMLPVSAAENINSNEFYYIFGQTPYLDFTGTSSLKGYNNTDTCVLSVPTGTIRPVLAQGGTYDVYYYNIPYANNYQYPLLTVHHNNGVYQTTAMDQINGAQDFYYLGRYEFSAGDSGYVTVGYPNNTLQSGAVRFNCVKMVLVDGNNDYVPVSLTDNYDSDDAVKTLQTKTTVLPEINTAATKVYVSQGAIGGNGSENNPFGTIAEAQSYVRTLIAGGYPSNGIGVYIASGTYELSNTLSFASADSGTANYPVIYQAYGGDVVFTLGKEFSYNDVEAVTDTNVLEKLDFGVRNNIYCIDLSGRVTVPNIQPAQSSWASVFLPESLIIDDDVYNVSSYPNKSEAKLNLLQDAASRGTQEQKRIKGMTYSFESLPRILKWTDEPSVICTGKFGAEYESISTLVTNIDTNNMNISFLRGSGLLSLLTPSVVFRNILSEIDSPGEFYIDRVNQKLYFYPVNDITQDSKIILSTSSKTGVNFGSGATNIVMKGISVKMTGADGVIFDTNSSNCMFAGGDIAYTTTAGATIKGTNNTLRDCDVYETGTNGIVCSAGNSKTVINGNCLIENNNVSNTGVGGTTAMHGISLQGCGNTARYNHVYDIPGQGVLWSGLGQTMEYNLVERVCKKYTDAGAFYTGGSINWGSKIRFNIIRDVLSEKGGEWNRAIYFDGGDLSGTEVEGNIISNAAQPFTLKSWTYLTNNIFIVNDDFQSALTFAQLNGGNLEGYSGLPPSVDRIPLYNLSAIQTAYPDLYDLIVIGNPDLAQVFEMNNNVYYNANSGVQETYNSVVNSTSFSTYGGIDSGTLFVSGKPVQADYSDIDWAALQTLNPNINQIPVSEIGTYNGGMRNDTDLIFCQNKPQEFSLIYPKNGAENLDTTINLQWENIMQNGGKNVTVYIAEDENFTQNVKAYGVTGAALELEFEKGKTYYWTVCEKAVFGYGTRYNVGTVNSFSTKSEDSILSDKLIQAKCLLDNTTTGNEYTQYKNGAKQKLQNAVDYIELNITLTPEQKIEYVNEAIDNFISQRNYKGKLDTYLYEDFSNDIINDRSLSIFTRNSLKDSPVTVQYESTGSTNKVTRIYTDLRGAEVPYHIQTNFISQDSYVEAYASIKMETAGNAAAINLGYTGLDAFGDYRTYPDETAAVVIFGKDGRIYCDYDKSHGSMSYSVGTWYNVAIKADVIKRTYSVYINGNLLASDVPFKGSEMLCPTIGKIMITETEGTYDTINTISGSFCVDNMIVKASSGKGVDNYLSGFDINGNEYTGFDKDVSVYHIDMTSSELSSAVITPYISDNATATMYNYNGYKYIAVLSGNKKDVRVYILKPNN